MAYSDFTLLSLPQQFGLIHQRQLLLFESNAPILHVIAVKKNDVEKGIAQCAAQLLGTRIYNTKHAVHLPVLYSCVTSGDDWLFMQLEDKLLINTRKLYLGSLEQLLGMFQWILEQEIKFLS